MFFGFAEKKLSMKSTIFQPFVMLPRRRSAHATMCQGHLVHATMCQGHLVHATMSLRRLVLLLPASSSRICSRKNRAATKKISLSSLTPEMFVIINSSDGRVV